VRGEGNGLSAIFAAFALLALTGNAQLLRKPGLYVAAAIVLVVGAPPLYVAYQLDAPLGDFGPLSWPLVLSRVTFYSQHLWNQLGTVTLLLALIGAAAALWRRPGSTTPRVVKRSLRAATLAPTFHLVSPRCRAALYDARDRANSRPAALGVMALTRNITQRQIRWSIQLTALGLIARRTRDEPRETRRAATARLPFGDTVPTTRRDWPTAGAARQRRVREGPASPRRPRSASIRGRQSARVESARRR
jgi:hypothetical protein